LKLLIVKFGALGDVVRTSYFLPGLLERYPSASIFWYTARSAIPLLSSNKYITTLFTDDNKDEIFSSVQFDYVISLDDEFEILKTLSDYGVMVDVGAFLDSCGDATYTLNSAEWFDMGLLSKLGKTEADKLKRINVKEHNQIFANILNIDIARPYFFNDTNEDITHLDISKSDFNIGLNSGAGGRWLGKRLLKDQAVGLINKLETMRINGKKIRIFLLGGEAEHKLNESIRSECDFSVTDIGVQNSLGVFAKIVSMLDLVITSDSLALHLAVAQGITTVSFFAPTSAAEIGVFGNGVKVISLSEDYCSYCSDADNSSITSDRLLDALLLLDKFEIEERI